jgi:hypothetical protein
MRPAPLSLWHEVAFLDEFLQAQLHRAGLALGELHDLAEREGFVIGKEGDELLCERVEVGGLGGLLIKHGPECLWISHTGEKGSLDGLGLHGRMMTTFGRPRPCIPEWRGVLLPP